MKNVACKRNGRKPKRKKGHVSIISRTEYEGLEVDSRAALIQALIPIGLMAVSETLQEEVRQLAGKRYARKQEGQARRHGSNPGSVTLAGQTVGIRVPRVRDEGGDIALSSYQELQGRGDVNERLFRRVLHGISCRDYEASARTVPAAIGLSKSTISRRFIETSAEKLKAFRERDLSCLDVVTLFIDGKTFADNAMILILAVTMEGNKIPIGFIQSDTENHRAIADGLRQLIDRGLSVESGVLCVVDGAKGLRKAVLEVFRNRCMIQRCQWHKRENVLSYLPKTRRSYFRRRLQNAYQQSTYAAAKKDLLRIHRELSDENQSAAASLNEGFEETLTLHKLGVFPLVGRSLKTTNCIESINAMAEQRCSKIDYWKNSSQKQRWFAAALIDIEPRLHTLMGFRHLPKLRRALIGSLKLNITPQLNQAA